MEENKKLGSEFKGELNISFETLSIIQETIRLFLLTAVQLEEQTVQLRFDHSI